MSREDLNHQIQKDTWWESVIFGETTPRGTSVQEFETPEAQRAEVDSGHQIRRTRVNRSGTSGVLREEASVGV
jgi:hypothetical protein